MSIEDFKRLAERKAIQEKARRKHMRRMGLNPDDLNDRMRYAYLSPMDETTEELRYFASSDEPT